MAFDALKRFTKQKLNSATESKQLVLFINLSGIKKCTFLLLQLQSKTVSLENGLKTIVKRYSNPFVSYVPYCH